MIPVIMIAVYSVGGISGLSPNDIEHWTVTPWKDFITSSTYMGGINPLGSGLFWKSVKMSLTVSVTALILAYPVAYLLAMLAGRRKYVLLLVIIVPFLTSYLLRILAWRVILNPQGVVNTFLQDTLGVTNEPIQGLWNSNFAIYVVLSYVWVPFVALPIFVTLEGIDEHLLEASSDLGASRWRTFWTVTFPLSIPGVIAGFIFVFIPTIGEFVTPQLVGGPSGFMFGSAIQSAFTAGLDWQFGSAMAMFLVFTVAILLAIFGRWLNVRSVAA
ncbi:MAG TPA: ABC transporter permease [Actinomycetota bacterium]|nr:ABC transporter permease [Actinomycetota bacterium]